MSKKTAEKLIDLEYNELVCLSIIESEDDLRSILIDEAKVSSFKVLITLSKENGLSEETKSFIRMIFDQIILTKQTLIDKYLLLASREPNDAVSDAVSDAVNDAVNDAVSDGVFTESEILSTEATPMVTLQKKEKVKKPKPDKELPRRYGRVAILRDIEAQDGKATPVQLTGLEINNLKNIYINLNNRLIKDMLTDNRILTDEDYRTINAVILIMKRKLADILKKK